MHSRYVQVSSCASWGAVVLASALPVRKKHALTGFIQLIFRELPDFCESRLAMTGTVISCGGCKARRMLPRVHGASPKK